MHRMVRSPLTPASAIETIVLQEEGAIVCPSQIVDRASPEEWAALGLTVQRQFGDAVGHWRIKAGGLVGVAELGQAASQVQVRIAPKIDGDLFVLADWAFGKSRDLLEGTTLRAHIDVLRRDPAACLIAWYLDSLEAFVVRW